jgi:hypothetical protein
MEIGSDFQRKKRSWNLTPYTNPVKLYERVFALARAGFVFLFQVESAHANFEISAFG